MTDRTALLAAVLANPPGDGQETTMDAEDFVRRVIRADRYRPISSDELFAFAAELRAALEAARAEGGG